MEFLLVSKYEIEVYCLLGFDTNWPGSALSIFHTFNLPSACFHILENNTLHSIVD
jgi:hypothetical protein